MSVMGDNDRGRLFLNTDYTVTNNQVIELTESYPAGTECLAVLNEAVAGLPFNRYTTANRPPVTDMLQIIDTDLNGGAGLPIWSDGTNWRDFSGVIV